MSIPNYEDNSQTIAVLTGFVQLMLDASPVVESVLGKPLAFNDTGLYTDDVVGVFVMNSADKPALSLTDRKSTRLNSSHVAISYAVFCLKKKTGTHRTA